MAQKKPIERAKNVAKNTAKNHPGAQTQERTHIPMATLMAAVLGFVCCLVTLVWAGWRYSQLFRILR